MVTITEVGSFSDFKVKFQKNMVKVLENAENLFVANVSKDDLWNTYLNSFPEDDGIRQSFNCNSCRQFIKNYGGVVSLKNNQLVSLWDFETGDLIYQKVVNALHSLVKSAPIRDVFVSDTKHLGTDTNVQLLGDGTTIRWDHFYCELPAKFIQRRTASKETLLNEHRSLKQVFKRALDELAIEATETVLELIDSRSLYRGEEFKVVLTSFLAVQKEYAQLKDEEKDNYSWVKSQRQSNSVSRIRNTSIGTLLIDLSEGVDLDIAVTKFEKVMAPTNYKRPKAIFTKKMVEDAEKKITELGLTGSLERRFATVDDVTVNNLLFVNRQTKPLTAGGSIFDSLKEAVPVNPKTFAKVQDVSIDEFINNVLPHANSIELLLENKHSPNLVSLIAPVNSDSPSLFKWDNGFSWSYADGVADSLKQKVKMAGGKVEGVLRASLEWFNYDDLDLHVIEPSGNEIYYASKYSKTGGELDVDMNAGGSRSSRTPVENIIYQTNRNMQEGVYKVFVNQFCKRERVDVGFSVEIECEGETFAFDYNQEVNGKVLVATFEYSKSKGVTIKQSIDSKSVSKELWGLNTNQWHQVNCLMWSPNHWDSNGVGNKHLFFMLSKAENKDAIVRGFFNEFLKGELMEHKRVFEAIGSRLNVSSQPYERQLSGVGFSTTQRASLTLRVKGRTDRVLKVNI